MRSTRQLRVLWDPPCNQEGTVVFSFWSGVRVRINGRCLEAFTALDQVLRHHRYAPRVGETWGYNCRAITNGQGWSLHAYGIAVDINSLANPYGPLLVTDMPRVMVSAILAITTSSGSPVWGWGGYYRGNKDAMHYEIVASPSELNQGVDWTSVERSGAQPDGPTEHTEPPEVVVTASLPVLRMATVGPHVAALQVLLNLKARDVLHVDSTFGPLTHEAARRWQRIAGLAPNGIVDDATWRSILESDGEPAN